MSNKERAKSEETVHLYVAVRRSKENPDLPNDCVRKIIYNEELDLEILKQELIIRPGIWRIYKTINKRSVAKATKLLQKKLIDHPDLSFKVETLFRTCLLQNECKVSRNLLVDVDSDDIRLLNYLLELCDTRGIKVLMYIKSPNGYHIVIEKFDRRLLNDTKDIEIKKDAYVFVTMVKENKDES